MEPEQLNPVQVSEVPTPVFFLGLALTFLVTIIPALLSSVFVVVEILKKAAPRKLVNLGIGFATLFLIVGLFWQSINVFGIAVASIVILGPPIRFVLLFTGKFPSQLSPQLLMFYKIMLSFATIFSLLTLLSLAMMGVFALVEGLTRLL